MSRKSETYVLHSNYARFYAAGRTWPEPGVITVQEFEGTRPEIDGIDLVLSPDEFLTLEHLVSRNPKTLTLRSPSDGDRALSKSRSKLSSAEKRAANLHVEVQELETQKAEILTEIEELETRRESVRADVESETARLKSLRSDIVKKTKPTKKRAPRKRSQKNG